jgi:PHD/YefM family antitoxin component YafN of YafNO toxin-antitoxin module
LEYKRYTKDKEVNVMPTIRSSSYLINNYSEVSEYCHSNKEPVFITDNGKGDLAIMSIETYDKFWGRYELYNLLDEALEQVAQGESMDYHDFIADFRAKML